jgi:hypothetical protein
MNPLSKAGGGQDYRLIDFSCENFATALLLTGIFTASDLRMFIAKKIA